MTTVAPTVDDVSLRAKEAGERATPSYSGDDLRRFMLKICIARSKGALPPDEEITWEIACPILLLV